MTIVDAPDSIAETYLSLPWTWESSVQTEEGEPYWIVTIKELPDFFAAGRSQPEAMSNYRDALLSLLESYLVTGKEIPFPTRRASYGNVEMTYADSESYCVAA